MTPLVSVLMPVHDAASMLPAALDSTLAQTLPDLEVVAVDDGSTDATPRVLRRYARADPRLRVVRTPHRGIVAALNTGLAACRGPFVARMDADDRMRPGRLEKQAAHLERDPGCDLLGCHVVPYGIGKALSRGAVAYHDWLNSTAADAEIRGALLVDSPIAHSTFFARRDFFLALHGYRHCAWAEDYDFLLRAHARGAAFAKVPEVLLERGDWAGRVTRTDPRCRRKAMFQAKAHFFARGSWLAGKAGVLVAGSGPSGRVVAAALRDNGVAVLGFVDNRAGPPGRQVMGLPAHGFPEGVPAGFLAAHRGAFFAVCVGEAAARQGLLHGLEAVGLRAGRDFARFI